jgi:tetratricopeptide (TPR) repeat protein
MPTRRLRVLAAAGLAVGLIGLGGCNKIQARGEIKKGNEFFKAGNYASALGSYERAAQLDPGEPKLKKFIGLTYMMMVQPGSKHPKDVEFASKAMENLSAYVKEHPEDKKANEYLVSMWLQADKYDEAINFYQQRLQQDPKDTKAIQSIASMYFKKNDFQKGFEWLEKRTAIEPNNPEAYVMIGVQAWDRSYHYPDIDPALRAQIVDKGIAAVEKALKLPGDEGKFDALTYINLLYREKAKIETDPAKQAELIATADKYRQEALDLRKKTVATTPTVEPAK